jgi:hypothetical protein
MARIVIQITLLDLKSSKINKESHVYYLQISSRLQTI